MSFPLAVDMADYAMRIIIACAMLMGAFIVLCLSVWYYRRRYYASESSREPVWTFDDLRVMRESGEISEDEYQALRASLLGAYGVGSSGRDSSGTVKTSNEIEGRGSDFDLEKSPHG